MFTVLTALGISKAKVINQKSLIPSLKGSPVSIVMFYSKTTTLTKEVNLLLDEISDKYQPDINFYTLAVGKNSEIRINYNLEFNPSIGIFRGETLAGFYNDELTKESFAHLCEALLNAEITYINSIFEVFNFQNKGPVNVLIADQKISSKAEILLENFGGLVHIGVVQNYEILDKYPLSKIVITHPFEGISVSLDDYSLENISSYVTNKFYHLRDQKFIGEQTQEFALLALINEENPIHIEEVSLSFKNVLSYFGTNISYQSIDFMKAPEYVNNFNMIAFNSPIYILLSRSEKGDSRISVFERSNPKPSDISSWLKMIILNEEIESDGPKIEKLDGKDFITKALDPTKDVILFIAHQRMREYADAKHNFQTLATIFAPYNTVRFYEFDPRQKVDGLSIPPSRQPQISVWPASEEPDGSTFTALAPISQILDNLIPLMRTEFNEKDVDTMIEALKVAMGIK